MKGIKDLIYAILKLGIYKIRLGPILHEASGNLANHGGGILLLLQKQT